MWRNGFRAFARWRHREISKDNRLIAPVFGTKHHGQQSSNDTKDFATKSHISLLETVGWVGTVLTVGLNLNLHSKRSPPANSNTLCNLLPNLFKCAFATPFHGSSNSVLPDESSAQNEDAQQNAGQQLEQVMREYFGHLENLVGIELHSTDAARAVKHFEKATALGASRAHYNLGVCYENGTGVVQDEAKAAYHYQRAALDGHGLATYNLGIFYLDGRGGLSRDSEKALTLIKKASALGVPQAKTYIGQHYFHQSAWDKALPLFREAAKKKDADASYFLGYCYENGLGVERHLKAAAHHYGNAAAAGDQVAAAALKELNFDSPQLHHSSSSPELSKWGSSTKQELPISEYLDLVLPDVVSYQQNHQVCMAV